MALYDLIVNISANTAELVSGMERAEASVKKFGDVVKTTISALAIGELVSFTEKTLAAGAAMEHAIQISGASATAFQQLAFAAKTVGVGADTLAAAMSRMERNISQAGAGTKAQSEALAALGTSFTALKDLRPEDQFEAIGKQIAALRSPMDQARASQALFGRSFQELLPLFKLTADEMEKLRSGAPILSEEQLKSLEEAHKSISAMTQSLEYLAEVLVAKVAPQISAFAKAVGDLATGKTTGTDFWQQVLNAYKQGFAALQNWQAGGEMPGSSQRFGVIERPPLPEPKPVAAPPGYQPLSARLTGIDLSGGPQKIPLPGEIGGRLEQRAAEEFYNTTVKLGDELKAQVITQNEFNIRNDEAIEKWHRIDDVVQEVNVHLKHIALPFTEAQVAARTFVDILEQAAGQAAHQGGNIGKNFLHGLLTALADQAIFSAIKRIGDALLAAIAPSAESGTGLWGTALGSLAKAALGYGGAPAVSGEDLSGYSTGISDALGMHSVSRRSQGLVMNYNIDARGADAERIMTVMPALLAQTSAKAKSELLDAFHRGGYSAPRRA